MALSADSKKEKINYGKDGYTIYYSGAINLSFEQVGKEIVLCRGDIQ